MPKPMTIIELKSENFKRLKAVKIKLGKENLVMVTGKNGQEVITFLESIYGISSLQNRLELIENCYERHLQIYHEKHVMSDKDTFEKQVFCHDNSTCGVKFAGINTIYGVGFNSDEAKKDLEEEFSRTCKFMIGGSPELIARFDLAQAQRMASAIHEED